ncbi:pentatricopeptide repeat-containing protein At5g06540-like [Arachis stenosperma]|uniref:pentatricopeptide repeat-containing protein At5g06540-like n=1 Tax=Arachis stenosperma TaxID=217475 RepID=UPI0025ABEE66|nr:pentatricopeptide repeat-containing protein At5g06540-like [Arachis stenosperma]
MSSIPPWFRLLQGTINQSTRELKRIHAHAITNGLARFSYVSSRLLAFYFRHHQRNRRDMRCLEAFFIHMPIHTVFDFNVMITAFSRDSQFYNCFLLFKRMLATGVRPNSHTFTMFVKSCRGSLSLLQQAHDQVVKLGSVDYDAFVVSSLIGVYCDHGEVGAARQVFDESSNKNVVCWTGLVTGYCNNGLVEEARLLFDEMPRRNEVSYSAMVSGYVRNGCFNEGIQVFHELKCCGNVINLNGSLLVSVLNACAAVGAFEEGKWIHSYIEENGLEYELELGTALIDFYTKCGWVEEAETVFDSMPSKDVATWSAMILGLAINGKNYMALELFNKMEKVGPKPNAVTFVGVLTSCNHKDLLTKAWWFFEQMSRKYGILPSIEHYGCMVDVLARGGRIKDALALVARMPIEPDGAIWGSLLNGCMMHCHVELAHRVGKYLIELEPQRSGYYILLANMYASMGKWEGVSEMRRLMKKRGVSTISAWSFIEIDQSIHKFVADDKCCTYSEEIYGVLNHLSKGLEDFSRSKDAFYLFEVI